MTFLASLARRLPVVAATAAATLALPLVLAPSAAGAEDDITDGLIAWYRLDETAGTEAANSAPGSTVGPGIVEGTAGWAGDEGFVFTGGPNGTGNAIRLPDNLNAGLTSISVDFDVFIDPDQRNYYMMWVIGNRAADGTGRSYIFGSGDAFNTSITPGTAAQEQRVSAGTLARGVWKHVTYTLTNGTAILYENGVERARRTNVTTTPASLGSTSQNFLGRSVFQVDQSFKGKIRDFRIYNRALDSAEVRTLSADVRRIPLEADAAALTLGDVSRVTTSLSLPLRGANGSTIQWQSSNPAVLAADGTVSRPEADTTVRLTATLRRDGEEATRMFDVLVAGHDDAGDAAALLASVSVPRLDDVRENLHLPTEIGGYDVSWRSSHPDVVSSSGDVTRPAHGAPPIEVTLTASVTVGSASAERAFTASLQPAPAETEPKAYLFAYFTGQGASNERIRYAISHGNDLLNWSVINDDEPILTSTLGTRGLRDPFLVRSPEGDRFYMIATDLNTSITDIPQSQEFGSRYIEVWESTDLVNWSEQRHVLVGSEDSGNVWAPEAFYDPEAGHYVVFWASNLWPSTDPSAPRNHLDSYNRMMYSTTRDFRTFTEPQMWIDEQQTGLGNGTIDSTVVEEDGWLYRFTVEEDRNLPRVDRTRNLYAPLLPGANPWLGQGGSEWEVVQERVGYGQTYVSRLRSPGNTLTFTEGEGTTIVWPNPGDVNGADGVYAFIDQADYYGGEGYVPFKATSVADGDWTLVHDHTLPLSPRHGTILPISVAEYEAILKEYQPDRLVTADTVTVETAAGEAPALPARVDATLGRGTASERELGDVTVTWDAIDPASYAEPGEFTVIGTLPHFGFVTARVTVSDLVVDVTPAVTSRCVAGTVYVVTTVRNDEDGPVSVELTSPYGVKTATVAAGRTVSVTQSTRQASISAVDMSLRATRAGLTGTFTITAPATSCR